MMVWNFLLIALMVGGVLGGSADYNNQHQWASECNHVNSTQQSPIDIPSMFNLAICPQNIGASFTISEPSFMLDPGSNIDLKTDFENNTMITFTNGSTTTVYHSLQFHWHSPSEHTVNGHRYPLEMHIVHKNHANTAETDLAVMGILFEEDCDLQHDDFDEINFAEKSNSSVVFPFKVLDRMLSNYRGSLTTPGCDQVVNWFVNRGVMKIKKENLVKMAAEINHGNPNSRNIQPLNNREVRVVGSLCQC